MAFKFSYVVTMDKIENIPTFGDMGVGWGTGKTTVLLKNPVQVGNVLIRKALQISQHTHSCVKPLIFACLSF